MSLHTWEELIIYNSASTQSLKRIPEPFSVTNNLNSVLEYNQILNTNMTVNYSTIIEIINKSIPYKSREFALELCCGPGLLTSCISKFLNFKKIYGIDNSVNMIKMADINKTSTNSKDIDFILANVLDYEFKNETKFDLILFANSAHHFESISDVKRIIENYSRYLSKDGVFVIFDLCRLKDKKSTESFVKLAGEDFKNQNLHFMYKDFNDSMYAAWLPEELQLAFNTETNLNWFSIIPTIISPFQAYIGTNRDINNLFKNKPYSWPHDQLNRKDSSAEGWRFYMHLLNTSAIQQINKATSIAA
jgi:ubiquinone/menaquinone biosynthesis C-methylase UbiE